jgi:serine/threonine protein kinase
VIDDDDEEAPESEYDDVLRDIARASERAPGLASSSLVSGSLIAGKFRVVRELGVGGMGAVYEVEHELTKHRRALKVLRPGASSEVVARFVREASAAARIGSAHVAQTFDAGRLDDGSPYLLMELLEGETLEDRLLRVGRVAPGELADLVCQACEGVHAAHLAGIIHRDLKPGNLFVESRDGHPFVKVLDFGISKFDEGRTDGLALTKDGSVMGTPHYMAPEQVLGSPSVDARTDVYARGVILYECACGVRPFEAPSVQHLALLVHEGRPVPLEQRVPSLAGAFCDVVRRAMAPEAKERFATVQALADALAPLRERVIRVESGSGWPGVAPRPSATPSRRRAPSIGVVLAAMLAGSAAVWWFARSRGSSEPTAHPPGSAAPAGSMAPPPEVVLVAQPPALPLERTGRAEDPEGRGGRAAAAVDGSVPALAPARPMGRPAGTGGVPRNRSDTTGLAGENPFR